METVKISQQRKYFVDFLHKNDNSFTFLRFILAGLVIVAHSALVSGVTLYKPFYVILNNSPVDAFFILSGALLTYSATQRNPQWLEYVRNRVLRVLPGFFVSLGLVAFFLGPALWVFSGENKNLGDYFNNGGNIPLEEGGGTPFGYVLNNASLWINQEGVAGTPSGGTAIPHVWNVPLWSLYWEFLLYLIFGVFLTWGVTQVAYRKFYVSGLFLFVAASFATNKELRLVGESFTSSGQFFTETFARFVIVFFVGVSVCLFANKIIVSKRIAVVMLTSYIMAVVFSGSLPQMIVTTLTVIPLAYLVLWFGCTVPSPVFFQKVDISYGLYIYAFPLQQIFVIFGTEMFTLPYGWIALTILTLLVTFPLAWWSWVLVEERFLGFKNGGSSKRKNQYVNFLATKLSGRVKNGKLKSVNVFKDKINVRFVAIVSVAGYLCLPVFVFS